MLAPLTRGVRSLLFPPACAGCRHPLETVEEEPLCPACRCRLPWSNPASFQPDFKDSQPAFDRTLSPFLYQGIAKTLITGLKYRGRLPLGRFLADAMTQLLLQGANLIDLEAVVPVPLHPARLRERGFNQAQILAARLAERLDLPCRADELIRHRATRPQTELSRRQRWDNLSDSFTVPAGLFPGSSLLLVDDVLTTGATAHACAAALRRAGAQRILVVTAARG